MFIYYSSTNYSAETRGACLVGVRCDKCGCEYCYQLERVGSGGAGAPYGIGKEATKQYAVELAEADLKKRLEREAELVPCPECGWLNEELVRGYRRSRYQEWLGCSGLVAAFCIPVSLIVAWFLSIGPASDRGALPYFLIWIPLFFILMVASMYPMQVWLRSRIQPNRNYPEPPEIPKETPRAMFFNEATGKLTRARVKKKPKRQGVGDQQQSGS